MSDRRLPLGILQLQNTPMTFAGCMGNPASFSYPVLYRSVPGAWVSNVVPGDPSLTDAFVSCAQELVQQGAAAIASNCGFAVRYQGAVAAVAKVPVSMSSLLLLPTLLATLPAGGRIGVLTFDSRCFKPELLVKSNVREDAPLSIAGLEGTEAHAIMSRPVVDMPPAQLEADVLTCVRKLLERDRSIVKLLFECVGFCPASAAVRRTIGLPVFDALSNADLLMAGLIAAPGVRRDQGIAA